MEQAAPLSAWRTPGDPRNAITIDQLSRMTSGLDFDKLGGGFAAELRLLYLEPDMAAFAESARLKSKPGAFWEYRSASTVVLSRVIRDAVGGHATGRRSLRPRELFDPLGMQTIQMEYDGTGTPVGGALSYASAQGLGAPWPVVPE